MGFWQDWMKSDRLFHTESDWKIFSWNVAAAPLGRSQTLAAVSVISFHSLKKKKKMTQKTHHEIIYSYILSASLSWTLWQVNRGQNATVYLHIYTNTDCFPDAQQTKHTITHIYTLKTIIQRKTIIIYSPSMSFQNYMTPMRSTKEDVEQNVNAALFHRVKMHVNGGFRAPKTT